MLDPESSPSKEESSFNYGGDQDNSPWFTGGAGGGDISPHHGGMGDNNMGGGGNFNFGSGGGGAPGGFDVEEDYDNEPPLLEELGIRFDHIQSKTMAVMYPRKVSVNNFTR